MLKVCQSCGYSMQKKEEFGTNEDGSGNKEFCKFCFEEGKFKDEGITMEEKISSLVKMGVEKMDMTEEKAKEMANRIIPTLNRWKE
jgi:hypothetical protein